MIRDKEDDKSEFQAWKLTIKFVCAFGLSVLLIVQSYQRIAYFLTVPTYISSSVVRQQEATFPTFTLCADSSIAYDLDNLAKHGLTKNDYTCGSKGTAGNENCPVWTSNMSNVSPIEVYDDSTYSIQKMVETITIQTMTPDQLGSYLLVLNKDNLEKNVIPNYHRSLGQCSTLSLEESIRQRGVRYVELKILRYGKVYFHPPGQFLSLNGRMGYKILSGDHVEAVLNYHEYRMLEKENPNYDPLAKDQNQFRTTCSQGNYDSCIYNKLEQSMMQDAGCTVPYMPKVEGRICSEMDKARIAFDIHWFRVTNQQHDCQTPCNHILTELAKSGNFYSANTEENSTVAIFRIYLQESISLSQEDYILKFLNLVADLGAYLTILLGVSVLDGVLYLMDFISQRNAKKAEEKAADAFFQPKKRY